MSAWAILTDTTRCTGCQKCVDACKRENQLGEDLPRRWKKRIDDLSSTRFTTVLRGPQGQFVRQQCRHCLEPACASACLVGALQKTPEGPVIYDGDKCMGCRYCMTACPYGIPRYQWEKPIPYIRKCTMCYDRVRAGERPACVEACPQEATEFGEREALRIEAHRRIDANPDRYVDRVYGEAEVGGTSVIYISHAPLDFPDFMPYRPELGPDALPPLTWAALSKVPFLAVGVAGVMSGIWWTIGRRMKLANEAAQAAAAAQAAPGETSETEQSPQKDKE